MFELKQCDAWITIGHFTVVCLETWPWIGSETGGDLVLLVEKSSIPGCTTKTQMFTLPSH